MSETHKALVRRYFELSNEGRVDDYVALLAPDFRLVGMGMPASGVNHDMSAADLAANARAYESAFQRRICIELDEVIGEGDAVVARGRSTAVTAAGIPYANQYTFWFTFRDGLVTTIREFCCTYTVVHTLRQGGVAMTMAATQA